MPKKLYKITLTYAKCQANYEVVISSCKTASNILTLHVIFDMFPHMNKAVSFFIFVLLNFFGTIAHAQNVEFSLEDLEDRQSNEPLEAELADEAKALEARIRRDGLRIVDTWSTETWVTMAKSQPILDRRSRPVRNMKYELLHMPFEALGIVEHTKALRMANQAGARIRTDKCEPYVVVDWMQEEKCRTPFYKKSELGTNVYEPLTCSDQGIEEPSAENPRYYFAVVLGKCPKKIRQTK